MKWSPRSSSARICYFRIKGVTIRIPPLRERREDIPLLIYYFLQQAAERYGKQIEGDQARSAADADELRLAGQRAAAEERDREHGRAVASGGKLGVERLPREIRPARAEVGGGMNNLVGICIEQAEKELIRNTLKLVERQPRAGGENPGHRRADVVSKDQGIRSDGLQPLVAAIARGSVRQVNGEDSQQTPPT